MDLPNFNSPGVPKGAEGPERRIPLALATAQRDGPKLAPPVIKRLAKRVVHLVFLLFRYPFDQFRHS